MDIDRLLKLMLDKGASDLHIKVPGPPVFRIDGELVRQENEPPVIPQFWGEFRGNLSVLDSLFCVGPEATRRLLAAASRIEPVT